MIFNNLFSKFFLNRYIKYWVLKNIISEKSFFEAVLLQLSKNPEALFRMLSLKGIVGRLSAQKKVLAALSKNKRVLRSILVEIPITEKMYALEILLEPNIEQLNLIGDSPHAFALALATHASQKKSQDSVKTIFANNFVDYLGSNLELVMHTFISKDSQALSSLLDNPLTRVDLFEKIAANEDSLVELLILSTALLESADNPSTRIVNLLDQFTKQAVFRTALQKDHTLRKMLLTLVENGYESAGEDIISTITKANKQSE
ncbi:MAG: hypothetical protein WED82_11290 [Balneolales bacterium]